MRYDFGAGLAGIIVIALGVAFVLDALDAVDLRFEVLLPIVAIAIGASAIVSSLTRQRQE